MYSKEYFVERFLHEPNDELLRRYSSGAITDEAKEAILEILNSRGISGKTMQPLVIKAKKTAFRQTKANGRCDYCGNKARFGAVIDHGQRFCSSVCLRNIRMLELSVDIPDEQILQHAYNIKHGGCPRCGNTSSAVEVRRYYRVWSAIFLTQWSTQNTVCCERCGKKKNIESIVFCLILGWWGFPWGLLITPAQLISNFSEMFRKTKDRPPSSELVRLARINLGEKLQAGTYELPHERLITP